MHASQFPSEEDAYPRRRTAALRFVRIGFAALGVLGLIVLVLAGAVAAILFSGATESGFIRDRIQTTLQSRLGEDYKVAVAKAVVEVDPVLGLVVEVDDIEVSDNRGQVVEAIPSTRIAVDPLALLRLRVSVTTVELTGAKLAFIRSADGHIHLGDEATNPAPSAGPRAAAPVPHTAADDGGFPVLAASVRLVDRSLDLSVGAAMSAGFHRFSLVDGSIDFFDAARDQHRRFAKTDLTVAVEPESGDLKADLSTSGHAGRWTASFERKIDAASGDRSLSGVFSQLSLADILPVLAEEGSHATAEIPLYGRADVLLAGDGAVKSASVRLDVGAGVFRFGEAQEEILLDEATIKAHWDVASKAIVIDPSPIYFGETRGIVTGEVKRDGDERFVFSVQSRGAILAPRDSKEEPLVADRIELSGVADVSAKRLDLDSFIIQTEQGSFAAAGSIGFEGETPSLAMSASLTPMSISTWKQMWPPLLAPGARRWAMQNIVDGRIASARFQAAVPPGILWKREKPPMPENAFHLDLRLEDVTFRTFGELPPVSGASGNAVLAGSTFGIDLDKAEVKVPSGATVAVTAGAFGIDNVFDAGGDAIVEVQLSGKAAPLGEIANAKPLSVLDHRGIAASDLSGKADATVSLRIPLTLPADQGANRIQWKVTVNGTGLASKAPIEGRIFSDAAVTIAVTPEELAISGKAKIDGVPADVSIAQPLSVDGTEAGAGEQVARLALDREARLKLGLDIEDFVSGTIDAEVRSLADGAGQHYDLDLHRARLTIPGLGWSKGIGVPATLSFDSVPANGGFDIRNIVLNGDGFGCVGVARLEGDAGLVSAKIDDFKLREGDSVSFDLSRTKSGYGIVAHGAAFDVRGVIAELKGDVADEGDDSDVTVEAELSRMNGYNGKTIQNAKVSYASVAGIPRKFTLTGTINGHDVTVAYSDTLEHASLEANSGDAGAVMNYLDVYSKIGDGHLAVAAEGPGRNGPLKGTITITDFAILDEPAVEQVASTAPARNGVVIDPARVHADRLSAQFRYTGDDIFVDEALLRGNTMGATFNGRFDLVHSMMSINGTYIPAYGVNNVFGRVPLVGLILGGGSSEGLIGVTFKIEGPIDDPRVFVNPLSAVAPGIFRKIFEFR